MWQQYEMTLTVIPGKHKLFMVKHVIHGKKMIFMVKHMVIVVKHDVKHVIHSNTCYPR